MARKRDRHGLARVDSRVHPLQWSYVWIALIELTFVDFRKYKTGRAKNPKIVFLKFATRIADDLENQC